MEPDQAQAQIRELEQTVAFLKVDKDILQTYVEEWTHRFQIMQNSRNRWRLCAMELADTLYTRLPNLPDLEAFYSLLHDPLDGDGL